MQTAGTKRAEIDRQSIGELVLNFHSDVRADPTWAPSSKPSFETAGTLTCRGCLSFGAR